MVHTGVSEGGFTHRLARFALEHSLGELPSPIGDASINMMINAAAAALAGASQQESLTVTQFVQDMGGNGKCTVIGMGLRTSPVNAALANGAMIHLLDFDDEIAGRGIHPSAVIFPVVMALAEMNGDTGRAVLNAFTVGCEITGKVGAMLGSPGSSGKIIPRDGTAGAVGAAAAAGLMLGLNQEQMESAFGLACDGAGGGNAGFSSPSRALPQGRAAMTGMSAALLAEKGLAGPRQAIEGPGGLLDRYGSGSSIDPSEALSQLADPYDVLQPGIISKAYPCHSAAHTAIDATMQLVQQYQFQPGQVESVRVEVPPATLQALPYSEPRDGWEARYSLNYVVAATLLYGQPLLEQFADAAVQDPVARDMLGRVTVAPSGSSGVPDQDPGRLASLGCTVSLWLFGGREISHRVDFARGFPEFPLEPDELDAKFLYCSRYILPPDHIDGAIGQFRDLANVVDVTGLASILGG
jgi:2-methylcitrate dehydratase PrpD